MAERELSKMFGRLQMCIDQLQVMQNVQDKDYHNLYRSIQKLDKQVGFLASQLIPRNSRTANKKRSGGTGKKSSTPPPEVEDDKRPSTGEDLSSNETDSSSRGETTDRKKSRRRAGPRPRRQRRRKKSEGQCQNGLTNELVEANWTVKVESFTELQLSDDLMTGLLASASSAGETTLFQQRALPAMLEQTDLAVQTSGSSATDGKAVAIALAVINKISAQQKVCQALVLTSSREAAKQIHRQMIALATFVRPRLTCHLSVGGTNIRDDVRDMGTGCHVVVGTLGRAFDMMRRGALKVADMRCVVLDDLDIMLTRRFDRDHIYWILGELSADVQHRMQIMFFFSMIHEDINKIISLYTKPPLNKVLVIPTGGCSEVPPLKQKVDDLTTPIPPAIMKLSHLITDAI